MNKTTALMGGIAVVGLGVAGWFFGPQLYSRLSSPVTPAGRIAGVEKVDSFAPDGAGNLTVVRGLAVTFVGGGSPELQAEPGYKLWVVHFTGTAAKPDERSRQASVVDDAGEKYPASWMQVQEAGSGSAALVFCLPEAKTPRKIQFGEAAPVDLP